MKTPQVLSATCISRVVGTSSGQEINNATKKLITAAPNAQALNVNRAPIATRAQQSNMLPSHSMIANPNDFIVTGLRLLKGPIYCCNTAS